MNPAPRLPGVHRLRQQQRRCRAIFVRGDMKKDISLKDISEILGILPHRYPFLLVDRILETDGSSRMVGLKNVTINEPFFQGHLPDHPVMPGVLLVEALAQVGVVLLLSRNPDRAGELVYFSGIDKCRFRHPVIPGDHCFKATGTLL